MPKYDLVSLDAEFSAVLTRFTEHNTDKRNYLDYYDHGAFYQAKPGDIKQKNPIGVPLLKAFADKNINYTSIYPNMKVPAPNTDPAGLEQAQRNEKIIYATHEENSVEAKQLDWSTDATIMAEAFAETTFDLKTRRVIVKRLDTRYCYYKYANQVDNTLLAFFYAVPMSIEQIKEEYGIEIKKGNITANGVTPDGNSVTPNDTDRAWVIKRWDKDVLCMWAGDQFIIKPHKHKYPAFPIDRCAPLGTLSYTRFPSFFLAPLVPLQAEFNETFAQKRNILRRVSKVAVIVKGVAASQVEAVKDALLNGGMIGLKQGGEASFLQLQETKIHDDHMGQIFQDMKDVSGFPTVTWGEIAGANTSGDAVSMYFQPTTQVAQRQWIAWKQFYQSINEKILKFYEAFGKIDEEFQLYGTLSRGTFSVVPEVLSEDGSVVSEQSLSYTSPAFGVKFKGSDIGKYYRNQVIVPSVTPKDELATKRLMMEAANSNFIPKIQAYEEWGVIDPKEWLDLLIQEQSNPSLNPDGMSKLMGAANGAAQATPPMPPELASIIGNGGQDGVSQEPGQSNQQGSPISVPMGQ